MDISAAPNSIWSAVVHLSAAVAGISIVWKCQTRRLAIESARTGSATPIRPAPPIKSKPASSGKQTGYISDASAI